MKSKKLSTSSHRRESTPYLEAARHFEEAIQLLYGKSPKKAREAFQYVIDKYPEEKEMADRARTYMKICEAGRARKDQVLEAAEDYYTRGTFRLNDGDYDRAIEDYQEAMRMDSKADYVLYSLATAYALKGETTLAAKALEKAIKMNPDNRIYARNDEDFGGVLNDPAFQGLLQVDVK